MSTATAHRGSSTLRLADSSATSRDRGLIGLIQGFATDPNSVLERQICTASVFFLSLPFLLIPGIDVTQPYFLIRFVSYKSSHDLGVDGLTPSQKVALVRTLTDFGRVYISSESALPPELEQYKLKIPASDLHQVMAFARMLVGESATMASESAVLGVTAFYISPFGRGFTDDQERRYQLVYNFNGERFRADWLALVRQLAGDPELVNRARAAQARMLAEKVDVTLWMVDFFEREYQRFF